MDLTVDFRKYPVQQLRKIINLNQKTKGLYSLRKYQLVDMIRKRKIADIK